jgi:hypothetical protein
MHLCCFPEAALLECTIDIGLILRAWPNTPHKHSECLPAQVGNSVSRVTWACHVLSMHHALEFMLLS